jgi:hypothetical protein
MNTITPADASAFQQSQVTAAVDTAVAVKSANTQQQAEGGVLELLSAAMAVIEESDQSLASTTGQSVNIVA